jgi:hypothetical protein
MHRLTIPLLLLAGCTWIGQGEHDERTRDADQDGSLAFDDCDDDDPSAYPGADEVCDGVDNDCDGEVDEDDAVDAPSWYADGDQDGFGDPEASSRACAQPSGYIEDDSDCDDGDDEVYPQAPELCDEQDNDCDGETDEEPPTWYADSDGDGYGDPDAATTQCEQPSGAVAADGDCDDGDAAVNPAATELCNGVDDDCDDVVDEEDAEDASTWYADSDGDDYGASASTVQACEQPSGYAAEGGDCDEGDAAIHPAATELCDGVDNDCDGLTDEDDAADASTWYADSDGDGYGDSATSSVACEQPSGFVADSGDCDDGEASTHPGATEYCDGHDDDCDGHTDEADAADASTWYADTDGDGYGDGASPAVACAAPSGTVADSSDCDDGDGAIHPAATELCDGADNDCDGSTDEDDAADASTWYADSDGDGWGDSASTVISCSQPSGYAAEGGDCDEGEAAIHPSAEDRCDELDNDCDGDTDEDAPTWYTDADGDGYGDPATPVTSCTQPSGTVEDDTDCDDGDLLTHPGASERWYDGQDQDCDGGSDYDQDGDGYDSDSYGGTDFDDMDPDSHPGALEVIDGVDNDGDGIVDYLVLEDASGSIAGTASDNSFGSALVAGDFDGDGVPDLVVGDDMNSTWGTQAGAAHLFTDLASGPATSADADGAFLGTSSYHLVGRAMAAGDLNLDTIDDLVLGMPGARVSLYYGPLAGTSYPSSATDQIVIGSVPGNFGATVAVLGDQTSDSVPDLAVASTTASSSAGAVYLYESPIYSVTDSSAAFAVLQGDSSGDLVGTTLGSADMDGDGLEDLLVGAPGVTGGYGRLYVVYNPVPSSVALGTSADLEWQGTNNFDELGGSLAVVGDINGDGRTDLQVGYAGINCIYDSGYSSWVILGQSSYPPSTMTIGSTGARIWREQCGTDSGSSLSGGDFDGDGFDDIVYGTTQNSVGSALPGRVHLLRGDPSFGGFYYESDFELEYRSGLSSSLAGSSVLMNTDFDGDGLDDLVVGAPGSTWGIDDDAVHLIYGFDW